MPPKARKKLGYNWRARQSGESLGRGQTARKAGAEPAEDTNALVLPARSRKRVESEQDAAPKRKRLSAKQRKRLTKILEVREKKAKRVEVLSRLASLSLPPSQMLLLTPSTSLSSSRLSHRTVTSSVVGVGECVRDGAGGGVKCEGVLVGTGWRVRRKRRGLRELRAEKELRAPRTSKGGTDSEESGTEESDSAGEGQESDSTGQGEGEEGQGEGQGEGDGDGSGASRDGSGGDLEEVSMETDMPAAGGGLEQVSRVPSVFVQLRRPEEVQESRCRLPVVGEEGRVMEAVRGGDVTVLCGETGSGKTTQLPQFLYEHGFTQPEGPCGGGMIAVTEPRRVAAVSMARRVAYEMGLSQRQVSYQIRYEGNATEDTVIKFMTDGVLLKEIEQDFLLERYSVVVVDEAHERSVFTDILLGLLSRILPLRIKSGRCLKLVVMSATLRVEDFTGNPRLFPSPPPTLSVESRQFPVTVHFNKRTRADYVTEAYRKVCKIHRCLPPGHVLVFVTGQREVLRLSRLLRRTFSTSPAPAHHRKDRRRGGRGRKRERKARARDVEVNLDGYPVLPETGGMSDCEEEGEEEGEEEEEEEEGEWGAEVAAHDQQLPLLVLPLYSLLSSERQAEVFQPVPEGVRLCVVATNIAETSITIPAVTYVVDCGKVKKRYYDRVTGISTFRVDWVSKASANQRAGRAGRTEPGHCYRLYSSAVFHNQFVEFSEPEICRRPVEDLVLQMKALGIERVARFPFPTPPPREALQAAEKTLKALGALSPAPSPQGSPGISALGRTMAQFPVAPRYAKMLALGHQHGCLPYVVTLVAALSVKDLFVDSDQSLSEGERGREETRRLAALRRSWVGEGEFRLLGDLSVLLRAVGAWDYAGGRQDFCRRNGLRPRAMVEVAKLRRQLTNSINTASPDANLVIDPKLAPPTQEQARLLRQVVLSGLGDHVARKIATGHMSSEDKKRLRFSYQCVSCEGPVYLPTSSPFLTCPPEFLVFQELTDTSRIYMRGVTAVEGVWLSLLVPQFCKFSEPLQLPPPTFDLCTGTVKCHVTCTYGNHAWPLPAMEMEHPPGLQRYRMFAMFLLQGKVCPQLAQFSAALLLPPITMVKSWAKLHQQTEVLLRALVDREVCSTYSLLQQWSREPKYLLKALSLWLPQSRHAELAALWPPRDIPTYTACNEPTVQHAQCS